MSDGQVISEWHHSHNCYICKKHHECSWMFCKDQKQRNCSECIKHFQEQTKGE